MPLQGPKNPSRINHLKNKGFSGKIVVIPAMVAGLAAGTGIALAQGSTHEDYADKQLSLSSRLNPEYDPQGIRLGDYTLLPNVSLGTSYDDNIYRNDDIKEGDLLYTTKTGFSLKSDFVRHALNFGASYENGTYRDLTGENYDDYNANISGRVDLTGQTAMPFSFSYAHDHIRRGSPDDLIDDEPVFFDLWTATTGLVQQGRLLAIKVLANLQRYIFENSKDLNGVVDNSDRDRGEYSLYTSIGMNADAFIAPFVYSNILQLDYDRGIDRGGFNRDAMHYEAGVGTIINFSDITSASFTVGRFERRADDPQLEDFGDFSYGVNLKWEPSTLASFLLSGDRTVRETVRKDVTGSIDSSLRLTMDYEMFPNLIIRPSAGISENEYQGDAGGRTVSKSGGLQFTYKMNQNLWLTTSYQYTKQEEKEDGPDLTSYTDNTYNLSLKLQF
jgi:hypothetical protein